MVRLSVIILLQVIFATSAVLGKSFSADEELTYIGTFKSEASVQEGSVQNFNENDYYISANPATWTSANADCRLHLGPNGTLLAVESEEEWQFLGVIMERYGLGTTFWTSGMFDPTRSQWVWIANNHPLPPFAPWAPGFPSAPNTLLRVLQYYTSRFDANWQTVANTQLHRYICELQRVTVAVPCYQTNDLAIVLDASGSIGAANFQIALGFVDTLVEAFTRHSASRLTYIVYASASTPRIPITNTFNPAQISNVIRTTPYTGGGTATHLGIDMAVAQFTSSPRAVPRNMVVLTDGLSNNPALTVAAANRAINLGIRTFSVGITPSVNHQELLAIAGSDPRRVFYSANFADLIQLLAPLSLEICP